MPNINISLSNELHRRLRVYTIENGATVKDVVTTALNAYLAPVPVPLNGLAPTPLTNAPSKRKSQDP